MQYATPRAKASSLAPERSDATDQAAALAALHSVAADYGVGLTPHQAIIQRAIAAVETVNQRMADLQKTGGMRDMNDEFKQARKVGTVVRYQDFLHANKMAMLKELPGDAAAAAASLRQVANGHRWLSLSETQFGWQVRPNRVMLVL